MIKNQARYIFRGEEGRAWRERKSEVKNDRFKELMKEAKIKIKGDYGSLRG